MDLRRPSEPCRRVSAGGTAVSDIIAGFGAEAKGRSDLLEQQNYQLAAQYAEREAAPSRAPLCGGTVNTSFGWIPGHAAHPRHWQRQLCPPEDPRARPLRQLGGLTPFIIE
jgi:hypothetical protein